MTDQTVLYHSNGPIGIITLNRPDKLNSLNVEMMSALHCALDQAEQDENIKVIILQGNGQSFCAGFDLSEMQEEPDKQLMRETLQADFDLIMRFWNCPKPTLSAIQGYALGGGFELAMACDVTIAAENSLFGEPEPKFGSGIVALLLPWMTGPKQAKEMLLFGSDRVTAARALAMGLINQVVDEQVLSSTCQALAKKAALLDTQAVKLTKQAINRSYGEMGMEAALQQALQLDLEIETQETEESRTFKQILKNNGVKAAIAWRESRMFDD